MGSELFLVQARMLRQLPCRGSVVGIGSSTKIFLFFVQLGRYIKSN